MIRLPPGLGGWIPHGLLRQLEAAKHGPVNTITQPCDVLVYRDGNDAVAKDCRTGQVIARSSDHAQVIQAAIDTAASRGGGVVAAVGDFVLAGEPCIKSGVRLVGGRYTIEAGGRLVTTCQNVQNVTIEDVVISAPNATLVPVNFGGSYFKRDILVRGVIAENVPSDMVIWVGGGTGPEYNESITVENVVCRNAQRCVRVGYARYVTIRDVRCIDVSSECVFVTGQNPTGPPYTEHVLIDGVVHINTTPVDTLVAGGANPIAVDVTRTLWTTVQNVYAIEVVKGVNMEPGVDAGYGPDVKIVRSIRCRRTWRSCVYITYTEYAVVEDVYAEDAGLVNDAADAGIHGILFGAFAGALRNATILRPRGHGVAIGDVGDGCHVEGVTVVEPNYQGVLTGGAGINLYNVVECRVRGNRIIAGANTQYGINESGTSDYNIITDNVIVGAPTPINTVGLNTVVVNNISK